EDLDGLRHEAYQGFEAPRMMQVIRRARVDDSPEGLRLQRYEREAESAVHRKIKVLERSWKNHPVTPLVWQEKAETPVSRPMIDPRPLAAAVVDVAASKAPNEPSQAAKSSDSKSPNRLSLKQIKRLSLQAI